MYIVYSDEKRTITRSPITDSDGNISLFQLSWKSTTDLCSGNCWTRHFAEFRSGFISHSDLKITWEISHEFEMRKILGRTIPATKPPPVPDRQTLSLRRPPPPPPPTVTFHTFVRLSNPRPCIASWLLEILTFHWNLLLTMDSNKGIAAFMVSSLWERGDTSNAPVGTRCRREFGGWWPSSPWRSKRRTPTPHHSRSPCAYTSGCPTVPHPHTPSLAFATAKGHESEQCPQYP